MTSDYLEVMPFTIEPHKDWKIVDVEHVLTHDFLIKDSSTLSNLADNKKLIVDVSREPMGDTDEWLSDNIPLEHYVVMTSNLNFLDSDSDRIIFFPRYYPDSLLALDQVPKLDQDVILNCNRKYVASCLNGRARSHRIQNFMGLLSKPYFDQLRVSIHNTLERERETNPPPELSELDPAILSSFEDYAKDLPDFYPNDWSVNDSAYTDSYINIVTETMVTGKCWHLSEKLWKPIISGQFGLYIAYPGTVDHLRYLGFDVFDDYIDHSYDQEQDWKKRIAMVHEQLDTLIDLDWQQIFKDTIERRLKNYKLFYSGSLLRWANDSLEGYGTIKVL
jgi:hypothetical protein